MSRTENCSNCFKAQCVVVPLKPARHPITRYLGWSARQPGNLLVAWRTWNCFDRSFRECQRMIHVPHFRISCEQETCQFRHSFRWTSRIPAKTVTSCSCPGQYSLAEVRITWRRAGTCGPADGLLRHWCQTLSRTWHAVYIVCQTFERELFYPEEWNLKHEEWRQTCDLWHFRRRTFWHLFCGQRTRVHLRSEISR